MFLNILEQSLIFFPMAVGIYISYAVLRIPDLTTDGSFVLGAALFATAVHAGLHPVYAMMGATLGGALAGIVVSLLQTRLGLNPLIAGILMVFMLNTIVLKVMGKPNLPLFDHPSIFVFESKLLLLASLSALLILVGGTFLGSRFGLMLHAFGNNPTLLHLSGRNANLYRMLGLSLSNGLVGYCGAITAQSCGYADIGMGTGMILIALGTVIIGRQIFRLLFRRPLFASFVQLSCAFLGIVCYFSMVRFLIALGLDPIYLRLMIGIGLTAFLAMMHKKEPVQEAAA